MLLAALPPRLRAAKPPVAPTSVKINVALTTCLSGGAAGTAKALYTPPGFIETSTLVPSDEKARPVSPCESSAGRRSGAGVAAAAAAKARTRQDRPRTILPGFVVYGLLMLTLPLIIDRNMGVIEAMNESWNTLKNDWLNATVFHFVIFVIGYIGIVACGIGLLFTLPLYFLAVASVYRDFYLGRPVEGPMEPFHYTQNPSAAPNYPPSPTTPPPPPSEPSA